MSTDDTTPTPAPVAVPEGGWRDGDWLVLDDRGVWHGSDDGLLHDERGRVVDADYVFRRGHVVYVHAPREAYGEPNDTTQHAPRTEPVTAPLPSEAVEVERLRALLAEATPLPWRSVEGDLEGGSVVDYAAKLFGSRAEDSTTTGRLFLTLGRNDIDPERGAEVVPAMTGDGPRAQANADLIVAAVNALPVLLDLLPAADQRARDEGTVREALRDLAQRWIDEDDVTQWGDHTRNRCGRAVLELLDGSR